MRKYTCHEVVGSSEALCNLRAAKSCLTRLGVYKQSEVDVLVRCICSFNKLFYLTYTFRPSIHARLILDIVHDEPQIGITR
ncbi:hypothetical protein A0H81_10457 [Grifola frondosa]|uniref:Uncharacterized protein n=1 Tax=Grifola frondosa TaxID=5627 RepID=A0A1C7LZ36_GRIFR|nr:hypothetical protein A0H81_10457 [Grifola frondosa]